MGGAILWAPVSSLLPSSSVAGGPAAILAGGNDPPGPRLISSSLFLGGPRARCYFGWRERSSGPPSHHFFPLPRWPESPLLFWLAGAILRASFSLLFPSSSDSLKNTVTGGPAAILARRERSSGQNNRLGGAGGGRRSERIAACTSRGLSLAVWLVGRTLSALFPCFAA